MKATLDQWRMFKAVVEYGGYARAAEAIHKSQSTISYAVHKLQEMLGVQLLEVEGRKAILTEHGRIMLARANQLLEQADNMGQIAASLSSGVEAKIRLALEMIYPYDQLFAILQAFSAKYPNTRIELEEYGSMVASICLKPVKLTCSLVRASRRHCWTTSVPHTLCAHLRR